VRGEGADALAGAGGGVVVGNGQEDGVDLADTGLLEDFGLPMSPKTALRPRACWVSMVRALSSTIVKGTPLTSRWSATARPTTP